MFSNVPQAPGQNRTFAVYVNAAPGSGETTITDSDSGSPTFTFSGSSTTPLGSGWYLLGTVTLAAGDLSSTVTVQYSGSGVSQVALLQQTSTTVYDAASNVVSQTDGLGNVTTYGYNDLQQQVSSSQGQIVPLASGSAAFANLPQTPGVARTFTVYVQASSAPVSGDTTITENGTASPTLSFSGSSATPLGSGWYELGTVTLGSGDASSRLTVAYSGSGVTRVGVVQQTSADTYTPTGLVASQTNADGGVTNYGYDVLGEQTSDTGPAPNPSAPTVRPVTSDVDDAIGRVTSITSPLSAGEGQGEGSDTTAYLYDFGSDTDTLTTLQGATVAVASGSAVFNNLPQAPGLARTYVVYVQSSSAPANNGSGYTITENGTASLTLSFVGSATTPLGLSGSDWYELGTVTLGSGDSSSTLTVGYSGSATVSQVALLAQTSARPTMPTATSRARSICWGTRRVTPTMTWGCPQQQVNSSSPLLGPIYDKAGNVYSDTDLLGNVTSYQYNDLGQVAVTTQPASQSGQSQPVTTDSYDADGDFCEPDRPAGQRDHVYLGRLRKRGQPEPAQSGRPARRAGRRRPSPMTSTATRSRRPTRWAM